MISLPNGCSRSVISVSPKNWNTTKASVKKKWKIHYRFYDPAYKNDPKLWGKQFPIRGMNKFKELLQRQAATKILLEDTIDMLDTRGFNPITGAYTPITQHIEEITTDTTFISALWQAHKMMSGVPGMLSDIKSAINGIDGAAKQLYDKTYMKPYTALKIGQVSRKHLIYLLEQCAKDNPRFTANRYNKYRTYLLMLFKQLLQVEAVDVNPAAAISIKKVTKKKRQLLAQSERIIIDTNLKARDYHFWRYMRIFHRSGSRSTEMLSITTKMVDLEAQEFTIIVKKGKQYSEDVRPIPDDILPLWQETIEEAKPGDYLFSVSFQPGPQKIGSGNTSKRWKKLVKASPDDGGMGIKKDFYSLKHLNADTIDELLDLQHAATAAGHADETMMKNHYAVNNKKRRVETLKRTKVDFT